MAAINDLIKQVEDIALQKRLIEEVNRLTKEKKFGLVFEEHLPELTPLYKAEVRKGNLVAKRAEDLTDLWRVLSVSEGQAECMNQGSGEKSQFWLEELLVVARFGEPIFPSLVPVDSIQNGADDLPWHTLIEADNYHALQLLEYLYAGQVDCIYIDPPYNTGARDWKYNNNYVDSNDSWRHSKWLAMMKRRLLLAKKLLSKDGVLIITIDDGELAHLECLLDDLFPIHWRYLITIEHNKRGRRGKNFAKTNEFAIYIVPEGMEPISEEPLDGLGGETRNLRRTGSGSLRAQRARKFYPIYIDHVEGEILEIGESIPLDAPRFDNPPKGIIDKYPNSAVEIIWPIDEQGTEKNWHYAIPRAKSEYNQDKLTLKKQPYGWQVYYSLREKDSKKYKTVWTGSRLDASTHGTEFLENILGTGHTFDFPKSINAVTQCLLSATLERPNALILDFFAGSGTTLNALLLINEVYGGMRRGILVTNNEVSETETTALRSMCIQPGESDWNRRGICESVTWPRLKNTIFGQREDGTEIDGYYLTGKVGDIEKPRNFYHISFTSSADINTVTKKKQLVRLIKGIPQSAVKKDSAFLISEKEEHFASVLFDDTKTDEWFAALTDYDHITGFYIVTERNVTFSSIKDSINELLGPIFVSEEIKRPIKDGFAANIEYYRLDFLERNSVELCRQFREILPLLWLRSGAVGPRPQLQDNEPIPPILLPEKNPFAVLVDETQFADFAKALQTRKMVTHAYLVTDSEEAFQEMAEQLNVPYVIQLYRDYIENFMINKGGW